MKVEIAAEGKDLPNSSTGKVAVLAAKILRALSVPGTSLHYLKIRDLYRDELTGALLESNLPISDDSVRKDFANARQVLEDMGHHLRNEGDGYWSLPVPSDRATSPMLYLTQDEDQLRRLLRERIRDWSGSWAKERAQDFSILTKGFITKRIDITYGKRRWSGIYYFLDLDQPRSTISMWTESGPFQFYLDAIEEFLLENGPVVRVRDPEVRGRIIEAPPVDRILMKQPRGRPANEPRLRTALHLKSAVQQLTFDGEQSVSSEVLSEQTKTQRDLIESLSPIVTALDPAIEFEDGIWSYFPIATDFQPLVSGSEALASRIDIGHLQELGKGFDKLIGNDRDLLNSLISKLDEFLSGVNWPSHDKQPLFSEKVILAMCENEPLRVKRESSRDFEELCVTGLLHRDGQWWVLGELDGNVIDHGDLAIESICDTD
jgi:hypothetical protein